MNSEELEQSLRTEFESYLKNVVAGMRQEVSDFQKMVEVEFEKHKSQMDDAFRAFHDRFASEGNLDEAFSETVVEHLRLARDEGARITATAIAEAEELEKQNAAAADTSAVVGEIRDAILEISGKSTQSAILKSLVAHAAKFTPRGAFFIIKNEHLVGWRIFGNEVDMDDKTVREVFFPAGSETLLGEAVRQLKTVEGAFGNHADDSIYLNRLGFGHPDRMYAIPLVVRERAVAVLYADYGNEGTNVNIEAIESLVQVAGLTVEISASARSGKTQAETEIQHQEEEQHAVEEATSTPVAAVSAEPAFEPAYSFSEPAADEPEAASAEDSYSIPETPETTDSFDFSSPAPEKAGFESTSAYEFTTAEEPVAEFEYSPSSEPAVEFESASEWSDTVSVSDDFSTPKYEPAEFESFEPQKFEVTDDAVEFTSPAVEEYEFESVPASAAVEFEAATTTFEPTPTFEVEDYSAVATPVVEVVTETVVPAPPKSRSRLSERNVDLPIEVNEDERRLHNDARRFARLLVSEIKLYNEQKVKEGREANDLYEKLKEAIDRSREMYDKRVQPPVAAKFDYFHYELVSNLAEGDAAKLGSSYPGAET